MGQYYRALIIGMDGGMQVLTSYDFSNGAKLMEHSWVGNEFVGAELSLIHNKRACVAWLGDYSNEPYDPNQDAYAKIIPYERFLEYYEAAWAEKAANKISRNHFTKEDLRILNDKTTGMYLVNHDRREYIDLGEYISNSSVTMHDKKWCVNPLPLLTACGNDRGGGDFSGGNTGYDLVGIWAFSVVEYTARI